MLPDFTNEKLFPRTASPLAFEVLGWNDAAATINHILASNRNVNTRLFKFREHLEAWLSFRIFPRVTIGGISRFDMTQQGRQRVHNYWYQSGIEEVLLYTEDHPQRPVPRGEEYVHATRFDPPYKPDQCDSCGRDFQEGLYVDLLILTNDILCSQACVEQRLKKVRSAEPWLQRLYPCGTLSRNKPRPDCPLPEDAGDLELFLRSIPAKQGTDGGFTVPVLPEMQVLKKVRVPDVEPTSPILDARLREASPKAGSEN